MSAQTPFLERSNAVDDSILAAVLAKTAGVTSAIPEVKETRPELRFGLPGFEGKARVATNFGDLPIEALRRRDMVKTLSGAYREVQWVDAIRLDVDFMERHPEASPVLIRAKALGGVYPKTNILVSPGQTIRVPRASEGHRLEKAMDLEGLPNIQRMRRIEIVYYRFHCGQDEMVCIEGSWFATGPQK